MLSKRWLIVIFVAMVSADFPFEHYKKFEDLTEITNMIDPLLKAVLEYKSISENAANQTCDANGLRNINPDTQRKMENLNIEAHVILQDVYRQIDTVYSHDEVQKISDELLDPNLKSLLSEIEQIHDNAVPTINDVYERKDYYSKNKQLLLGSMSTVGKSLLNSLSKLSELKRQLLPITVLKLRLNEPNKSETELLRCGNFEMIQKQIYFLYLRLVRIEIGTLLRFFQTKWLHIIKTGEIEIAVVKSSITTMLERIKNYIAGVYATLSELSSKCNCQSTSTMSIMTNESGTYNEFYPISDTKHIMFQTNATKSIHVHLATGNRPKDILFSLRFGEAFNTRNTVLKNGRVIESQANAANVFVPDPENFFDINWESQELIADYVNRMIIEVSDTEIINLSQPIDRLLPSLRDEDLSKITHFTVTSPFVDTVQWNFVEVQPRPTGPANIVKQIRTKSCN